MKIPLDIWDVSLLFAAIAIILLITSEFLNSSYGKTNIKIDRNRLRNTTITFAVLFLVTVGLKIATIALNR